MKYQTPEEALKDVYGYDSFRGDQKEIIQAGIDGRDGLVILSTGGGKSVCFQIPGLMREGVTLVVSPLIALMKDQVDNLRKKGVKATCFYHKQNEEEKQRYTSEVLQEKAKFIYVSPERLANPDFLELLKRQNVSYCAIDEAHCISSWGHQFRQDYRLIGRNLSILEEHYGRPIQVTGFTATATPETREDIIKNLNLKGDAFSYVGSFDRPNISIEVRKANNKFEAARDIMLQNVNDEPSLIYCPTVNGVLQLQSYLKRNGIEADIYHGRLTTEQKNRAQDDFVGGKTKVMVATSAFGTGIDVSNIRLVVHLSMPGDLESYSQEVGRAGRDGEQSRAILIYNRNDINTQDFFIRGSFPGEQIIESIRNYLMEQDTSAPFVTTLSHLADACTKVQVTEWEVESSIKKLVDAGLIDRSIDHENIDYANMDKEEFAVEFIDITKEIDFDNLKKQQAHMYDKLGAMQRFCETTTCRRTFQLQYLGENHRAGANCGSCDNCNRKLQADQEFKDEFTPDAVASALKLINGGKGKISSVNAARLLRGVENRSFARKGWNELEGYAELSTWNTPRAQALVAQLEKSGLVQEDNGSLKITGDGVLWMNNDGGKMKAGIANEARKNNRKVDLRLRKELHQWVKSKADELEWPIKSVMADDVVDSLASEDGDINLGTLSEAGLSRSKLALYGQDLVDFMKLWRRRAEEQRQSPEFS